ncbi:MAG: ATP-binding cassette domain-containing protein [Gammaproteobacteria bacterium]|nr:ATP-binding cassette domain-containing protein [Gammaproteobacteria bacterium]MDH5305045.1 ATP-binding cassette domain-containing protein [Gammaproteobacteria bacterium]MDH5322843.1 ATP-binding cassette domain-containing protein [Gammaproteobacteria bacterium]
MRAEVALVDFHNATIWRGTTRVFENLNLSIAQHERVAILGPNGSGKTTLLKTIIRDLYPQARPDSWIRILGRDRWDVWELRRRIGIVSHDLHMRYTPTTTALEVVLSGFLSSIGTHGLLADRVRPEQVKASHAALVDMGIASLRDTSLAAMSTGQQRRCLLARALVHRPATLVLDEPTAGLDIAASFDYLRQIRRLAEAGQNILIVTHHLNEIPREVDRVVLLKAGAVFADGSKAEVLTSDRLSELYETPVRVANMDGYFLAYPG